MRTRSLWLLGGLMIVVAGAFFVGHSALAAPTLLGLEALEESFPSGGETDLLVTVDPVALGGHGELYSKVMGSGEKEFLQTFSITSQSFTIPALVTDDPEAIGKTLMFRYMAFDAAGAPLGWSSVARGPIVEPEPEDF